MSPEKDETHGSLADGGIMSQRSDGQRIGSMGQRLVELLIERTGNWVSRRQDEDFGIDLEAEISKPSVCGEIIKIQIKSQETPEITPRGVNVIIESKYLRLAQSLRVPLVFVLADITGERAWFLWLQGWLADQRRDGRTIESFAETVTVYLPETETLLAGLQGPLVQVARWGHENQMLLSLIDTLKTAIATQNQNVLLALANLIKSVDSAYRSFPLEQLIDTIVERSAQPRAAWELSMLGHFLGIVGRSHGEGISKQDVMRMVIPGDGYSRAGLVGLGALYDEHEAHLHGMDLSTAFEERGYPEVAFYCRLREKYPGVKSKELAFGDYEYTVGSFAVVVEDKGWFLNKWANRGESAYLDYLEQREGPSQA